MSVLPDWKIKEYDMISPFNELNLQPCSYDLTLGEVEKEILEPNDFVLGATKETIKIPKNLLGRLDGKSTLGREGITVHITAGFIDPGFRGQIVLEIKNLGNKKVDLRKFKSIAQISFEELSGIPDYTYGERGNHYQNQKGIVKSYLDDWSKT